MLARLGILGSVWAPGGLGFVELPAVGGRGRVLGVGGRGVTGALCIDFSDGRGTLAGSGWEVGGASFWAGGVDCMGEGRAVLGAERGLLVGGTDEGGEGLEERLGGVLGAVMCGNGWAVAGREALVEPATEARGAGGAEGSALLAHCLAGGGVVQAGPPAVTCLPRSMELVLRGLGGVAGATVTLGPLPAGRGPRAGVAVVKFSMPGRARSVWKAKVLAESRRKRGPSWGRYTSACTHCFLRWLQ